MNRLTIAALLGSIAAVIAPSPAEANWEHLRIIGQRLGLPRILTVGTHPTQSVAIADVDADGDADIVVSSADSPNVTVFLGDASQPFRTTVLAPASDWATVDAETSVDGTLYRAQSSALFRTTTVRAARASLAAGALALVADADGDGTVDLVAAPAGAMALASGDFDGDGIVDLVSAGSSTSVTMLFGRGGFTRRRSIDVGIAAVPHGLAAGDLNEDGLADLVILSDSGTLSVLIGEGSGGLIPMTHLTVGRSPAPVAALATTSALEAYEGISSLTLNPPTIAGGSSGTATGTVTLNAPAPAGGVLVTLTSSNTELAASEPTLIVPAGATTATFVVGTNGNYRRYSGLAFSVTLTATHGATAQSATLGVTAQPRPGTLSSFDVQNRGQMCFGVGIRPTGSGHQLEFGSAGNLFECVPPSSPNGQDGTCTFRQECALGCELRAPQNGSNYRDVCATGGPFPVAINPKLVVGGHPSTATLRLNAAATASSSGVLSSLTVLANTIPNISTPIPVGATTATADVLTSRVSTPQFAPIDGLYSTPRSDGSRSGRIGLAWLALTPGTPPPFGLTSFTFDPSTLTSVAGGTPFLAIAQMNQVAPAPELAVASMTLTSSNPAAVSVPASVTFTHGSSSAAFFLQTHAVSADTPVTLTARVGDTTLSRQLTVKATPPATRVKSFFLNPLNLMGGQSSTGTVVLDGAAPAGGAIVTLHSANTSAASVPASVTVPAGSDRTNFTVTTGPVSSITYVSLTARFNGTWAITTLTVAPAPGAPALASVTMNPSSVTGGGNSTGTIALSAAAPAGGAVVSLSSSSTAASVPAGVTVPAGATSATFTATTSSVAMSTPVTISASYAGVTRTSGLTVAPAGGQTATLTVTATGRSGVRVTSTPTGINVAVGSTASSSFTTGTSIRLSVPSGREAVWSGACSSGGSRRRTCTFTLNANASVTANVR
jgi:hypothetical protein